MKTKNCSKKSTFIRTGIIGTAALLITGSFACSNNANTMKPQRWEMGTPITTYFAGPPMKDAAATQMKEGGFNLVWTPESGMQTAQQHGLRWMLQTNLLNPRTAPHVLDDPVKFPQLQELIARVKDNPQLYGYYIIDEPNASQFEELGKTVAYLRRETPGKLAYINLLPTYATNKQLGTSGDKITAYKAYLRQYIETVKPDLLSYDHYHFSEGKDGDDYFLNLSLIRQAALEANIPFMGIVQACKFSPNVRTPNANELRWLNYTQLAYGSQGISYFVYSVNSFYQKYKDNPGQMMTPDGTPTPQYEAAKKLNPQFVAIASQLKSLHSLHAYHLGKNYSGTQELPKDAPFQMEFSGNNHLPAAGILMGYFGKADKPTHVLVVNLDYANSVTTTISGPQRLAAFDAVTHKWDMATTSKVLLHLPPGGGILVRISHDNA